jgi:hypothetical protein
VEGLSWMATTPPLDRPLEEPVAVMALLAPPPPPAEEEGRGLRQEKSRTHRATRGRKSPTRRAQA